MEKKTNEYQLDKLKTDFQNIRAIIEEVNVSKSILLEKIEQLKLLYQDLIKTNNTKIFLFCLDSLHFQYKLFLMDYDSMENTYRFVMNRMYSDYYKLYNIIALEMNEKGFIEIKRKSFPQYKDLDVLREYKIETIIEIHNEILSVIDQLYAKYRDATSGIENYVETKKSVVSISNFLNTLKYKNGLLENQIMLYINYISFFHFSQKKMLVRLYSKMVEFNKSIDEYSNINNIISIDDINSVSENGSHMTISAMESVIEYGCKNVIKNQTSHFIKSPVSDITTSEMQQEQEEKEEEEKEEQEEEKEEQEEEKEEQEEEKEEQEEDDDNEIDLISLTDSDEENNQQNMELLLNEFYKDVFPKELENDE